MKSVSKDELKLGSCPLTVLKLCLYEMWSADGLPEHYQYAVSFEDNCSEVLTDLMYFEFIH